MASQREIAINIQNLKKQKEKHEEKIQKNPNDRCVLHWKNEVAEFDRQIARLEQQLNSDSVEKYCYYCKKIKLFNGNKCTHCRKAEV